MFDLELFYFSKSDSIKTKIGEIRLKIKLGKEIMSELTSIGNEYMKYKCKDIFAKLTKVDGNPYK